MVGDARQSIYRFRGAAPSNTTDFEKDYPNGKRLPLAVNYRSRKQIVETFGAYAGACASAAAGTTRGRRTAVLASIRSTSTSRSIAALKPPASLQRSSATAKQARTGTRRFSADRTPIFEKIAEGLEASGVPVLYWVTSSSDRKFVICCLIFFTVRTPPWRPMRLATRSPLADVARRCREFLAFAEEAEKTPLRRCRHR